MCCFVLLHKRCNYLFERRREEQLTSLRFFSFFLSLSLSVSYLHSELYQSTKEEEEKKGKVNQIKEGNRVQRV